MKKNIVFFDSNFEEHEQLLREYTVNFVSLKVDARFKTKVSINGTQIGDIIDDNSEEADSYRFHDVFHYTFATMLGWSPCTRAMMKRKRKSIFTVDEFEDGARATITEEAISLLIFNKAKQKDFFKNQTKISSSLLKQIKELTSTFEVAKRSKKEWECAILKGYSLFNDLVKNNGGNIHFNMIEKTAIYELSL
ncbi:nucleotide pyrophosphohydrolase [Flavobacterium sp. N1736]|uniref:nucleotide pyrophosphohydrolase n=1 Tax=Flavobacterium sp. N1736 TaxID=2986823 RepID=UPI002225163A|nr:nucleotide pyrophosphohydrolase [Flavobacterium sp. N1736]